MLQAGQLLMYDACLHKQPPFVYACHALQADPDLLVAVYAQGLPLAQQYATALSPVSQQVLCVEPHNAPSPKALDELVLAMQVRQALRPCAVPSASAPTRCFRLFVVCDPAPNDPRVRHVLNRVILENNQSVMAVVTQAR